MNNVENSFEKDQPEFPESQDSVEKGFSNPPASLEQSYMGTHFEDMQMFQHQVQDLLHSVQ